MTDRIHYISTRGQCSPTSISSAIAAGLASDGGLYVPDRWPQFRPNAFNAGGTLAETAAMLLAPFFAGDPLAAELPAMCAEALDFPMPLRALPQDRAPVLELFHGPTAAFKDVGARFLAACLRRLPRSDHRPLTILVATSGDTGAAVGAALHRQANVRVVILYPDGRVSPRQAHQLGSFDENVITLRVQGNFDDCQRMVKAALNDPELQQDVPLSSANSISLGRLLPQMSYYAHSAVAWWRDHGVPLDFIVPTGNLGNALACLWVRELGLPVGRIHLACNANATLPEYFADGRYRPRESVATLATAMDVGAPSNFERMRWTVPDIGLLKSRVAATSVGDTEIRATIRQHASEHGEVFCPHTACAVHVLDQLRAAGTAGSWAVVATAHPAKFEEVVEPLVGHPVPVPPGLAAMLRRPSSAEPIDPDVGVFTEWLRAAGRS